MIAACLFILACLPSLNLEMPPVESILAVLTWYDPGLCAGDDGEINCDSDPLHLAGMTPVTEDLYGVTAACIPEWFDRRVTLRGYGRLHCLDTGGAIRPFFSEYYGQWVVPVDALLHEPPAENYQLFEWSLE